MQAVALGGTLITGVSALVQGQYQSAIARVNAQQQRYNAEAASHAAQLEAQDIGRQAAGERGRIRVTQGASGLAISSPSFISGLASFDINQYTDALRTQYKGNQQGAAYRTAANIEGARGDAASAAGGFALASSPITGLGSFIGSAGATTSSPSYIPIPRLRSQYGAA